MQFLFPGNTGAAPLIHKSELLRFHPYVLTMEGGQGGDS